MYMPMFYVVQNLFSIDAEDAAKHPGGGSVPDIGE